VFGTQSPIGGGEVFNPAPSGYESLPSGNASDDAQFAAAAAKNKNAASPNTISVENINWYNIQGPYTTQAAANAAIAAIQKKNPAPGTVAQIASSGIPGASTVAGAVNTADTAITSVEGFLQGLTSANLWIRAAKIVAGGAILIVGLVKLTGADKKVGSLAAKAVKVAPLL
jgi:hypothetical protein